MSGPPLRGRPFAPALLAFVALAAFAARPAQAAPPHPGRTAGIHPESGRFHERAVPRGTRAPARMAASGDRKVLMLRVDFQPDADPETTGDGTMTTDLPYAVDLAARFRQYYLDNSLGALRLEAIPTAKVYRLPFTMTHYGQGYESSARIREMFAAAVALSDADIDYSDIEAIVLFHAGWGQESDIARGGAGDTPNDIWSMYIEGASVTADGRRFDDFTVVAERQDQDNHPENSPLGILCHEFGHELGLVDLYDIDGSSSGVGDWCLMSHGAWLDGGATPSMLSPWSRRYAGFISPAPDPADGATVTLRASAVSADCLMLRAVRGGSADEYFLVENRRRVGWDAKQKGDGVLVWHIDERVGSIAANNVNADERRRRVTLKCANGLDAAGKSDLDYKDDDHPTGAQEHCFVAAGKNTIGPATNPSTMAWDGVSGDLTIVVEAAPADEARVRFARAANAVPVASRAIRNDYFYPNPATGAACRMHFELGAAAAAVEVKIYNAAGRVVNKFSPVGKFGVNDFVFSTVDFDGRPLKNGVYFYKIVAETGGDPVSARGRFAVAR